VHFAEHEAGTMVVFVHEGVPDAAARAAHARGWSDTLDALSRLLATRPDRPPAGQVVETKPVRNL
jgi:hypothetical protein